MQVLGCVYQRYCTSYGSTDSYDNSLTGFCSPRWTEYSQTKEDKDAYNGGEPYTPEYFTAI